MAFTPLSSLFPMPHPSSGASLLNLLHSVSTALMQSKVFYPSFNLATTCWRSCHGSHGAHHKFRLPHISLLPSKAVAATKRSPQICTSPPKSPTRAVAATSCGDGEPKLHQNYQKHPPQIMHLAGLQRLRWKWAPCTYAWDSMSKDTDNDSLASQHDEPLASQHDDKSLNESKSSSKSILTNLDETVALLASLITCYENNDGTYDKDDYIKNAETTKHSANKPMMKNTEDGLSGLLCLTNLPFSCQMKCRALHRSFLSSSSLGVSLFVVNSLHVDCKPINRSNHCQNVFYSYMC